MEARRSVDCGVGNIDGFHGHLGGAAEMAEYAPYFEGMTAPWNFATPAQTAQRLAKAGFVDVETWLQDKPVTPPEPREFLRVAARLLTNTWIASPTLASPVLGAAIRSGCVG